MTAHDNGAYVNPYTPLVLDNAWTTTPSADGRNDVEVFGRITGVYHDGSVDITFERPYDAQAPWRRPKVEVHVTRRPGQFRVSP